MARRRLAPALEYLLLNGALPGREIMRVQPDAERELKALLAVAVEAERLRWMMGDQWLALQDAIKLRRALSRLERASNTKRQR